MGKERKQRRTKKGNKRGAVGRDVNKMRRLKDNDGKCKKEERKDEDGRDERGDRGRGWRGVIMWIPQRW